MTMTPVRVVLGVSRALVGLSAWSAPDRTVRLFGIPSARADRFVTRLFGCRDLALGLGLLAAPAPAVATVAASGIAIDVVDAVAGFQEAARGNLSTRATLLGPVGAVLFAALGVMVRRQEAAPRAS